MEYQIKSNNNINDNKITISNNINTWQFFFTFSELAKREKSMILSTSFKHISRGGLVMFEPIKYQCNHSIETSHLGCISGLIAVLI